MKRTRKIISVILSVLLLLSVIPMTAFATGSVASVTTVTGAVTEYADIHEAFDFACENIGSTITLLSDIDLGADEIHIVDCDITLELNGKTLQGSSDDIIWLHRGGKMTVKDSVGNGTIKNIEDNSFYAITNFGELTIESGNFIGKSAGVFSADRVVIKGGTFTGDEYGLLFWTGESVNIDDECDLDIDAEWLDGNGQILGGTFNGGIYIENWDVNGFAMTPVRLYLLDILADGYGFFGEDGNEIFVTEYQSSLTENITVKESLTERPNVAKVELATGEAEYFIDIFAAFTYANKWSGRIGDYNPKIVLLKDIELSGTIDYYGWNRTTIDLNGKTLSSSGSITLDVDGCTIIDSIGGGAIVNTAEENGIAIYSSSVTLNNVDVISNSYAAIHSSYEHKPTVTINGGNIYGKEYGIFGCFKLNITDGVIKSDSQAIFITWLDNYYNDVYSEVNISGGTIIGGIECAKNGNNYLSDILSEGYYFYDTDDNLIELTERQRSIDETVTVKNRFPVSVTQPDGTTEYFPTVDEGVDKANQDINSKLKLLKDILLNSSLTIGGITFIDLNGKTLEVNDENEYAVVVEEGASLGIEDTGYNGTIGSGGVAVNGGTLNFNSGNIASSMDGIYNNGGSVTVNGGAISSGEGYDDIFVEGENTTIVYGGAYEDGFSIGGTTINEALADGYVFYNGNGAIEIEDNQKVVSDNVVVYEKTIVTAMSSQIRFNRNDDGSYAGTFDVRTRAKISDADFKKYIADTNEEAAEKISKVGFVYSTTATEFNAESAKTVAQGGTADGFTDAPVSYIQDADGYYVFTCMVMGITEEYLDNGLTTYAYICVEDIWYFFPVEVTAEFGELYGTYYPLAAEQYGWEI